MTGPALSRAECQRLSGLVRLGLRAGLFGVQYEDFLAIADLVESYALPEAKAPVAPRAELGEEEVLEAIAATFDDLAEHAPSERIELEAAAQDLRAVVHAMAAGAPPSGVDREAEYDEPDQECVDLALWLSGLASDDIDTPTLRSLEAEARLSSGVATRSELLERAALLLRRRLPKTCGASAMKAAAIAAVDTLDDSLRAGERPASRAAMAYALAELKAAIRALPEAKQPASPIDTVDRAEVLAILSRAALELSPDMTEAATIADCIVLIRDLPEAKP